MNVWRFVWCAGTILVLGFAVVTAADEPKVRAKQVQRKKVEAQPLQSRLGVGDLLSAKAIEKLNLDKDQKEKFDKINQEYGEKRKEAMTKLRDFAKDRDREKLKEALESQKNLRGDYLAKVEKILTDTQKKTFEEVRRESPIPVRPIGALPGAAGGAVPGQILPPQAQERLKLTDEQKKKLDALQKEIDTKLQNLLTEEQKKILEQMKQQTPTRRPGVLQPAPGQPKLRKPAR